MSVGAGSGIGSDESVEIVLDRHSLALDNGCELRGLSGPVRVHSELESGQLWYLRIVDSPSLRSLDLTACPGGFDLEIDSASHCNQVLLPRTGASLLLSVARGFPATRFDGWIDECQLICHGDHRVVGGYRITDCDGLALLPDGNLERRGDVQCYLRIDQSERGLQFKRLRPRVKPDEIAWQLLDARGSHDRAISPLMTMRPEEFSHLALESVPDVARRRRELLEDPRVSRAGCLQLIRLYRRGFNPRALWAWRCMLLQAAIEDPAPERLARALLCSRTTCSRGLSTGSTRSAMDLRLFMLCRSSGLTRRRERHLLERGEPLELNALVELCATLPRGHPWMKTIDSMIRVSMGKWRSVAALTREEVDRETFPAWRRLKREKYVLEYLTSTFRLAAARSPGSGLRNQLLDLACEALPPKSRIRMGVHLCEEGTDAGRQLVASGLQESPHCGPELQARAMRSLLSAG